MKRTLQMWALMLLAWLPLQAWSHASSNSYLTLTERAGVGLVLRADVNLRDADLMLDLDGDRDGQVRWGEVQQRSGDLWAWLQQGLHLTQGEQGCELRPLDLLASERADGLYLSAELHAVCPMPTGSPVAMALRYGLLFEQDQLHRGLLRVDLPNAQGSLIFSPERPQAAMPSGGGSAWQVLVHYLVEGVWHIWIGADHIAFLLSLLLLAPLKPMRWQVHRWPAMERARPAMLDVLAVVTAFTVAHSITLALAVLQVVQPPVLLVEVAIALSVVIAALNNLVGWAALRRWRLAFVFGLIHGFGFANVLVDLGLPARDLAVALGGFNLGVELGQLAIVLLFFPIAWLLRRTPFYRWVVVVGGSVAIALAGLAWTLMRLGLVDL